MFLIYTPHITNRLSYVLNYIFNDQLGIEYLVTDNKKEILEEKVNPKIIYADESFGDGIFIYANTLLFETEIKPVELNESWENDMFVLFKHEKSDTPGFDLFAAVFYLLSRYEEYYNLPKDKFGNYDFKNSVLYKQSVLDIPVVEKWIHAFKQILIKQFPSIQFKKQLPQYILSFDIDVAYAYQNRSLLRVVGGLIKKIMKLQVKEFFDQLLTILYLKHDMYDTFSYILSRIKNKRSVFFFNMGRYAQYDKNPSYRNKKFRAQIKEITKNNMVGLHPSFASNSNYNLLKKEKRWLEEIIEEPVKVSRQHYLKLRFPQTYNALIHSGIEEDFTIGYHDTYGFRAGTCKSFLFFDIEKNETTELRLYPFSIMEGTLNDVMKLSFDEANTIVLKLISYIEEYNGIFIPLWHNSTLSNSEHWKGWRKVFEYILDEIGSRDFVNLLDE